MRRRSGLPTKRYVQRSYTEGNNLIFGTVLAEGMSTSEVAVVFDAQGTITCVGCGCRDEGQAVIDCGEHIVSPGFINAHDHIGWIHQPPAQWGVRSVLSTAMTGVKASVVTRESARARAAVQIRRRGESFDSIYDRYDLDHGFR